MEVIRSIKCNPKRRDVLAVPAFFLIHSEFLCGTVDLGKFSSLIKPPKVFTTALPVR